MATPRQQMLLPSVGLFFGGAMWGAIWMPLRAIGDAGPQLAWPGLLLYLGTSILLLPLAIARRADIRHHFKGMMICGLLTGAAFSFYATSLLFTDVVRSVLLFYLTPVWGTILGALFLAERLTLWRALALVTGLAGMVVVLWEGGTFPWPGNIGDWLALISGMIWALGALQLNRYPAINANIQILGFLWGALCVTAVSILVFGPVLGEVPSAAQIRAAAPLVALTALYALPMLYLTIWPARLLSPGRAGLLLMSEVIVATITAFLFSGEAFGLQEVIGTLLIVSAALLEVLGPMLSRRRLMP